MKIQYSPFFVLILLFLVSCSKNTSSPQTAHKLSTENSIPAKNNNEKMLLQKAAGTKVHESFKLNNSQVTVSTEYYAASGKECKLLEISTPPSIESRAICKFNDSWKFAPNIFNR